MKLFFERSETDKEIIVVHKPYFLYFFLLALALWVVSDRLPQNDIVKSLAGLTWLSALVILIWRYISMRGVLKETREALNRGEVAMSGSKFNPSHPLTVRIRKSLPSKPNA